MADVRSVLSHKSGNVHAVDPSATVREAAQLMNRHKIGALVVVERRQLRGIFTERDVLRRIVAECRDPAAVTVREVMTAEVVTCPPDTDLDTARSLVMQRRIRHLPVVDADDRLVGMISIGDLNAWDLNGQEVKIAALEEYLYGMA
jgi:CBS domain-containing protein